MKTNTISQRAFLALFILLCCGMNSVARAQGPRGNDFGFGLILGDPLGGTIKYWTSAENAFDADIGASYFGAPRVDIDYLWHFNAFRSSVVKMYAGPGLAVGFGTGNEFFYVQDHRRYYYRVAGETGFGARVIVRLNIIPRASPIEVFLQAGPLIGISPSFGASFDAAIGIRFYP